MFQASDSAISTKENTPNPESSAGQVSKTLQKDDPKKRVLSWQNKEKEVQVKTFSGYTLKLKGWVRKDILDKNEKDRKEQALKEQLEKEREADKTEQPEQQKQLPQQPEENNQQYPVSDKAESIQTPIQEN